jgi:hypothetical protein
MKMMWLPGLHLLRPAPHTTVPIRLRFNSKLATRNPTKRRKSVFSDLFGAISHHLTLHQLVPDEKTGRKSLLFTILLGDANLSNKRILNVCILIWARSFWKNGFAKDDIRCRSRNILTSASSTFFKFYTINASTLCILI